MPGKDPLFQAHYVCPCVLDSMINGYQTCLVSAWKKICSLLALHTMPSPISSSYTRCGDGHFYSVCSRNELTNAYLFLSPRFCQLGFLLQISPPSIVSQVPTPQPLRSLPSSPFFSPWQLLVPSLTLPLGLSPVSFLSLTQQSQGQQATVRRPALTRL